MDFKEIGQRIRYLRTQLLNGMSQEDFAMSLKTSRDVINNIEGNRLKKPEQKMPLLELICSKYDINMDWLLTGEGSPGIVDEQSSFISQLMEDVDPSVSDLILSIMKVYIGLPENERNVIKKFAKELSDMKKKNQG